VCAVDVNLLDKNINLTKKHTEGVLDVSKEIGTNVNTVTRMQEEIIRIKIL